MYGEPAGQALVSSLQAQIQERLGETFVVERELGGGGMSRVFVARDLRLERRVVVKLLKPELAAGVSVERFRREIRVAASLQHPLIVPVLDVGEMNGLPFFLMPFVEGESLRMRVTRGPLPVVDTVRILRDVARALVVAHAKGVVHRDIKPDNVLLSGDAAVVADFGVAKALASARHESESTNANGASMTTVGTSLGTPAYMAPEQVAADPDAGPAMDLYALGVMAYEMLAGTTPFSGRAPHAMMAAHITEAPPLLTRQRPDVPAALNALIETCLEKDPARRPANAAAVVERLEDPTMLSGSFTPIPSDVAAAITGSRELRASMFPDAGIDANAGTPVAVAAVSTARNAPSRTIAVLAVVTMALVAAWWVWRTPYVVSPTERLAATGPGGLPPAVIDTLPSVAVLPFVYLGSDSTQAFLARAIADAVTDGLARLPSLRVSSRSAAEALQQRLVSGDTSTVAVRTFVEGVVEEERGIVRLSVRLVNATDGFTLFADRVEGRRSNLFALEDEVAAAMRDRLTSHFGLPDSTRQSMTPS
jgi:eukaryotic-like serine/threonine-protein kinase